jgi:hypothetical protein
VVKYPDHLSIDDAMDWLRAEHVTHVLVDDLHDLPPGIAWLRDGPVPPFLIERFSTRASGSRWPIRIFEIRSDGGAEYYSPR